MANVLAIDPSLTGTGLKSASVSKVLKNKLRGAERIAYIRGEVLTEIRKSHATHIFIEELPTGSRQGASSVIDRAELMGVLRLLAYDLEIPFVEVPNGTLKKYATGNGNAKKPEMVAHARERFGYPGYNDDEADAWLLWFLAYQVLGTPKIAVPKKHLETIGKVVLP